MIDADVRSAIYQLHLAGTALREISRQFRVSRNAVREIIREQGALQRTVRKDKIQVDPELLRRLYDECEGRIQRMHEKLVEEEKIAISYSTLTRLLRELNLGSSTRHDRVPDEPGAEMQHDTTVYRLNLAGVTTRVIASLLYLRYSKVRYLRFYRVFNRFLLKCFLHEALMYWRYSAHTCIIDNTNLARLRGTGKEAVIVPEMAAFAQRYGTQFICHAIRHSNRKAGVERGFWGVETNFLPGRIFTSLEDLNRQALEWATVRMHHRPVGKSGLIPAKAFEHERAYLTALSPHLPPPYQKHARGIDQYGYVSFDSNFYWVPGEGRGDVKVLEYADCLKIFQHRTCLAEYQLPPDGVRNERFSPEGHPLPRHQPRQRQGSSHIEEGRLRGMGVEVVAYLDYALKTPGIQRHRFLRELFALSQQVTPSVFARTLERARRYRVVHLSTLQRIAWLCTSQPEERASDAEVDESFRQRPAYQEGALTEDPDLSRYDPRSDEEDEPHQDQPESEDENG
jgi:hypothetical protein